MTTTAVNTTTTTTILLKQDVIQLHPSIDTISLPPTPTASDDEDEPEKDILLQKSIKLQRRETVSLADLIPVASAALRAKHQNQSTQDSALARALTKVKIGVQTHRLKEKYLFNEWIRLALAAPLDESSINSTKRNSKRSRTLEIVKWYEHKFKKTVLSLDELEKRVDSLRRQRLLLVQQQQTDGTTLYSSSLPSPPATHLTFPKIP